MRKTYTPTNASLVRSNCDHALNRDQSLSVHDSKTIDNNLEGNLPQHTAGQNLRVSDIVYVLNQRGEPLMPTTPRKAKLLLKRSKANVVKRKLFTIQLNYQTGENKQECKLGVDSGSHFIGLSAKNDTNELLAGEAELDDKMKSRLDDRRMYRRNRRNKLWYRKPRFMNRKVKEGWLPPSIERKYQTQLSLIRKMQGLLPICKKVRVEIGNFDIQKLENPEIEGKEYQQGNLYKEANKRLYLFARENSLCQFCNKSVIGHKTHSHHIIPRSQGGTDRPSNLALLHEKCHDRLHKKGLYKIN